MSLTEDQIRIIFGLKLKQARTKADLSLFGLSKLTGLSKSYLNEIEKGKKYPKPDKIALLTKALNLSYDDFVSMKLSGSMAPLSDIIMSDVLKEIPLELFGIEESNLIDIIANAPEKVTSFIGTIFELARHYNINKEQFYLMALRSYQEQHLNYFPELEKEVKAFARKYQVDLNNRLSEDELKEILESEFGYTLDYETLTGSDYPEEIRSFFIPNQKKLLISPLTSEAQRIFILAKELGFAHLKIKQRPHTFTWIKFEHFEEVLNNFKASYFAGALMLPEDKLVADLKPLITEKLSSATDFLELISNYTDSAETFFQRMTNLLPHHFGLNDLFFLRFATHQNHLTPILTKELHLNRSHQPHANRRHEHYCSRWVSTDILQRKEKYPEYHGMRFGMQRSLYPNGDQYIILSASNEDPFQIGTDRSVCIGVEMNSKQKKKIKWTDDDVIPTKHVGVTCQRCPISDCNERVSPPVILEKQKRDIEIEKKLEALTKLN